MNRSALIPIAALVLILLVGPPATAQEAQPLQKSDVIRLLSGGTYTQAEVASIVGRSCLSFRPTERDLENFRDLGASDRVMSTIQECAEREVAPAPRRQQPAPPPRERPPANAPAGDGTRAGGAAPAGDAAPAATLFISPRRAAVAVGEDVEVTVELTFGAAPAPDVRLALQRGTPGEGGEVVSTAVTGSEGRATFRIPPAGEPGLRWFSVLSPDRPIRGENVVEVRTESPVAGERPDLAPPAEEGRSEPAASEEGRTEAGGTAPADLSPGAESPQRRSEDLPLDDREAALAEAERLSLQGRYGRAEAIFRRLLQVERRDVNLFLEYGRHLTRAGEHATADRALRRAETLDPTNLEALKARAFVKLWLDEPGEAVLRYRRVVDLNPRDVEAWWGLARALTADGRPEEARRASLRAAELESPD